jgi:hypothetical protein
VRFVALVGPAGDDRVPYLPHLSPVEHHGVPYVLGAFYNRADYDPAGHDIVELDGHNSSTDRCRSLPE